MRFKKVMIVDDSSLYRKHIRNIIDKGNFPLQVVTTAPNGKIALMKLENPKYKPDVITMDIKMPVMDGFTAINLIMERFPTPVVVVSNLDQEEVDTTLSNLGMNAFESGAVEFVKKPDSSITDDHDRFQREIIEKISSLSQVDLLKIFTSFDLRQFTEKIKPEMTLPKERDIQLIVIGASTGGPRAISLVLSQMPSKFPPIIIVQHMFAPMVKSWTSRLQELYPHLKINLAEDGDLIQPDHVYVAPGGKHCGVTIGRKLQLITGLKVNHVIPAVDVTFKSAAETYGSNILGVVLTGMGKDGFEGAKAIKAAGGKMLVEDEETCVVSSMPRNVIQGNLADKIAPLQNIPSAIQSLI